MFYDIFSKKKENILSRKIIVDHREKSSLVVSELLGLGLQIEFKQLEIGDYIINNLVIERKTLSDLQSSILDKRIFTQIQGLLKCKNKLMIIENSIGEVFLHENSIRGLISSIVIDNNIPIIFTKDAKDTAKYIELFSRRGSKKRSSLRAHKKFKNKTELIKYILEGFPQIGPKTAEKLVSIYPSLKEIINADESSLKKILGNKYLAFKETIN